jgi:hypothetical protein
VVVEVEAAVVVVEEAVVVVVEGVDECILLVSVSVPSILRLSRGQYPLMHRFYSKGFHSA